MATDDELAQTAPAEGSDELAQTATAPATPSALATPPRATLGRFRIEAILGSGGMGIVHAAFDPELERKVALKVLRKVDDADARARLFREARAMAKLSHPNVINVFDVGSAGGEDFVAMELVDGETLGEWLARAHPHRRAIVAAFIAAGEGLAAAHAAGLVHRDFKPSNVLRSRGGRIVVTDFGLARTAHTDRDETSTASSASAIGQTHTGALVGTPRYMAPEQWSSGTITAATDQFAFCVALWEALAGMAPFAGQTNDELRSSVLAAAPRGSDKLPRALRPILRRGLARDPAQRFATMSELLGALHRAGRTRRVWIAAAALVAIAAAIAGARTLTAAAPVTSDCAPSTLDIDAVWSVPRSVALAAQDPEGNQLVGSDVAAWRKLRKRACDGPAAERPTRLACLDGSLARLDAAIDAVIAPHSQLDLEQLAIELVDPAVCDTVTPPVLTPITAELSAMFRVVAHAQGSGSPVTLDELAAADRASTICARTVRTYERLFAPAVLDMQNWVTDLDSARDLAAQCGDEKIRAAIAVREAEIKNDPQLAHAAVSRCPQADLGAAFERARAKRASQMRDWDAALTAYERAIELYGVRRQIRAQLSTAIDLAQAYILSGRPRDHERLQALLERWLPRSREADRAALAKRAAQLRWLRGDFAGADHELEQIGVTPEGVLPTDWGEGVGMIGVTGVVVTPSGQPVGGATVASGWPLVSDAATPGMALYTDGRRATTTAPDGTFKLVLAHGTIVAQQGAQRSRPTPVAPHVRIVLDNTSHLDGRVELGATPAGRVWIVAHSAAGSAGDRHLLVTPVHEDGSFSLDGVPRGRLVIGAVELGVLAVGDRSQQLVVDRDRIDGIVLTPARPLQIIARSADLIAPDSAQVWVSSNTAIGAAATYLSLMRLTVHPDAIRFVTAYPVDLTRVPSALAGKVRAGDLVVEVASRPTGELVVCAFAMASRQYSGRNLLEVGENLRKAKPGCTRVDAARDVVTLNLPPLRKLEPSSRIPDE